MVGIVWNDSIHTLWQLGYIGMLSSSFPLPWMAHQLTGVLKKVMNLIGNSSIFSKSSQLHGVASDKSTETGRQQRENFTKPKWKNYDFTMFWSRITTSRCIAVK